MVAAFFQWFTQLHARIAEDRQWSQIIERIERTARERLRKIIAQLRRDLDHEAPEAFDGDRLGDPLREARGVLRQHICQNDAWPTHVWLMANLLVDDLAPHVETIIDRSLPRLLETERRQDLLELMWAMETRWLDLVTITTELKRHIKPRSGEWSGDLSPDGPLREMVMPRVPLALDDFFSSCQGLADYFTYDGKQGS